MRESLNFTDSVSIKMNNSDIVNGVTDIKVVGEVEGTLLDEKGQIKERFKAKNLVVNNGKYGIAAQLMGTPDIPKPTYMGIGSGSTAPAVTDTALGTELTTSGTRASVTTTRSNNVISFVASFGAGVGTGAVQEAGLFTASTAGSMYSRVTFSTINKGASDTLQLTWTYTIS